MKKIIARLETGYRSAFSRLILGNGNGDALGLPKSLGWTAAVVGTVPVIYSLETARRHLPGANRLAIALGRLLHEGALPTAIRLEKADTTFTPVRALAR